MTKEKIILSDIVPTGEVRFIVTSVQTPTRTYIFDGEELVLVKLKVRHLSHDEEA